MTLIFNLPDVVSAGASFRFIINTTSDAVDRTINLTGTEQTISVDTGSLIRIVGRGVKLEVLNNDVSGDFGFQQEAGGQIIGQIDNGRFAFHDGSRDLLVLDNGVGALVATTAGLAFEFGGNLTLDVPEVSASGNFSVSVNTSTAPVNKVVNFTGTPQTLSLPEGKYVRVDGSDASLEIAGQSLSGAFKFERNSDETVIIGAENVALSLGDDLISISNGIGGLLVFDDGIAGSINGKVALDVPGLSTSASFGIRVNTTVREINETILIDGDQLDLDLPQGRFLRVESKTDPNESGVRIEIASQTLSGNFFFEQRADNSIRFVASAVALNIGKGVVNIEGGAGDFEINQDGIVGGLSIETSAFDVSKG